MRRRFVTMRSCSSQIMSLPVLQKAPGITACTRQTSPPQIILKVETSVGEERGD
jgi:hypothetical protein